MRRAIIASLALLGLVAPCLAQSPSQGPPDFGIDTSGTLRNLSVRDATLGSRVPLAILNTTTHSFVSATSPVEAYGARGNSNGTTGNGTDDTAAIEACVTGGRVCALRPGATYRLMSAIDIPSNGGLIGDKTATLYCDPAGINNTSNIMGTASNTRYGQNAGCIRLEGPDADPANALANVVLKDFRINWGGNSGGRCCHAISARNVKNMTVQGLEIYNGSAAGLQIASWQGGQITGNYIHDFSNDTGAEYSAIEGDNDRPAGFSDGIRVTGNRIVNMLISEAGYNNALADAALPDGYQSNGIKFVADPSHLIVTGNTIENVGQGIDSYSDDSVIAGNTIKNAIAICLALKHTSHRNIIANNNLSYCGSGALALGGDAITDMTDNLIIGNNISNIQDGTWAAAGWSNPDFFQNIFDTPGNDGSCISEINATLNYFTGNLCDPGPHGEYMWTARGGLTAVNYWIGNRGNPGIGTINDGRWYSNGDLEPLAVTDDADVRAYKPWVDVPAGVSIPLNAGNLINVTGTTAIVNDFIGGVRGQVSFIKFNGAMTLRCTGNLICPNGTNIITAANDVMSVAVEIPKSAPSGSGGTGGAYRVLWYRPALTPAVTFPDTAIPVNMTYTNDANGSGPSIVGLRISASPAASDDLGVINQQGKDSGGNTTTYTSLRSSIQDPTDGSEDSLFTFQTQVAGTLQTTVVMRQGLQVGAGLADPGAGGIAFNGQFAPDKTITTFGTTGAQTINKPAGQVNFAAGAASLVVTNSLVTGLSIVLCTVESNDTTMKSAACVPGTGSFTIYANANPTAEARVGFLVLK